MKKVTSLLLMLFIASTIVYAQGNFPGNTRVKAKTEAISSDVMAKKIADKQSLNKFEASSLTHSNVPGPNSDAVVIRYDDGVNSSAIGLNGAGATWETSTYWPASTMAGYVGLEITEIDVFIMAQASAFVLKFYGQDTPTAPGALLYEQAFSPADTSWNNIVLTTPLPIAGDDLWIGYSLFDPGDNIFPAGTDAGPALAGFGDMLSLDGVTFESMSISYGLNYNWNIAATLVSTEGTDVGMTTLVAPVSGINLTAAETIIVTLSNYGTEDQSNIPWELTWGAADETYNDIYTGPLLAGTNVDITLPVSADLSVWGDYDFMGCTSLAGDANPGNDCFSTVVTSFPPDYCESVGGNFTYEWITNVQFSNLNNPSGASGYTDFTALPPALVTLGEIFQLDVTIVSDFADYVTAWIDFNQDFVFDPLTEEFVVAVDVDVSGVYSVDVPIPPDAPLGETRMRVKIEWNAAPGPCDGFTYGEVEDYTVNVLAEVSCDLDCPPEAIPEGEECAGDEYVDNYNGGCLSDPPVFQPINVGDVICGTSSTYIVNDPELGALNYRDTDWYEFTTIETLKVYWTVEAEFPLLMALMTADDCIDPVYYDELTGAKCEPTTMEAILPPGTYRAVVAPAVFTGYDCASEDNTYIAELTSEVPVFALLRGTVTDNETEIPIPGVLVSAGLFSAVTSDPVPPFNQGGQYAILLPTGIFDVTFEHPDYYPYLEEGVEVTAGDPTFLDAGLDLIPPGAECITAWEQPVNGAPASGTVLPGEHWWYSFTLDEDYVGLNVSACGSDFDTKLVIFEDCEAFVGWPGSGEPSGAFAYNDDNGNACEASLNSHIDDGTTQTGGTPLPEVVPAGTYYVAVYGYSATSTGDYMLEVYGIPASQVGWLNGMVTDPFAKAPVEGITITAAPFSTQTGADGMYEMAVQADTYDVTAEGAGYVTQTISDVVVAQAMTTTVDFDLEFAAPVLVTADPSYFDVFLEWEGNPLFTSKSTDASQAVEEKLHGPTKVLEIDGSRATGDDCTDPIVIDALPYTTSDATCGRGNAYDATCLGSYDGGEDIIYELTITEDMFVQINMSTETTWTGMLLTDECPPGDVCIATSTNTSGGGVTIAENLTVGTYYIMIDTWPSPACIPDFTLTVEEVFQPYYEVYRVGTDELLATTFDSYYLDETVVQGEEYCYEIIQYAAEEITLGPSNEMCASIPFPPEITVDPLELNAIHDINETSTQLLTITNSGPGPLDWTASIDFGTDNSRAGVVFEDNMDAYTAGNGLVFEANAMGVMEWTTWDNAPGTATDPLVTTAQANSAPNSFVVEGTNDAVLLLGDLTTGQYNFEFKIFVPTGYYGYFNILHLFDGNDSEWGLQVYFDAGGIGIVDADGAAAANFTFNYDEWIDLRAFVDLDSDWCNFYVNDDLVVGYIWSNGTFGDPGLNQLGAANFYAWAENGTPRYYIDDVMLSEVDPWLTIDPMAGSIAPDKGFNEINVDFSSYELPYGIYNADIVIASNDPDYPVINVPVEMLVGGILTGLVTDQFAKAPVEGVTITAEELRQSTVTGADGTYLLGLAPGNYEVTAQKAGYVTQTLTVSIVAGQTTTLNFDLEFAAPVLLSATPDFFDVTLVWETNPLFGDVKDGGQNNYLISNEEGEDLALIAKEKLRQNKPLNKDPKVTRGPGETCEEAVTAVEGLNSCPGASYWYEYTPAEDLVVTISTCMDGQLVDTRIYVYDACEGTQVAYNDDLYEGCPYYDFASAVTFPATGGTSYKIWWDPNWSSDPFDFILETEAITAGATCEDPETAIDGLNSCPGAPFWYEFTPTENSQLTITSCMEGQTVDTRIYVYDACGGTEVAYGDDEDCEWYVYASTVSFPVYGGTSYKIFWDPNWDTAPHDFYIETAPLCEVECPAGAIVSAEPCPTDDYVDTYNGGCNSDPAVFEAISCGETVCGTAATYLFEGSARRDTDWYELVLEEPKTVTFSGMAEFPLVLGLLEQTELGIPGCENITGSITPYSLADPCMEASISVDLPPGTYYFFVGLQVFEGYECGGFALNDYYVTLTCEDVHIPYVEVYRDDTDAMIATVYYSNTYVDENVIQGSEYCYYIYEYPTVDFILGPSNTLCATIPYPPVVSVDPGELFETLEPGETSMQTLSVFNDGLGDLDFNIGIQFTSGKSYNVTLPKPKGSTDSGNTESNGELQKPAGDAIDAIWDLQFVYDVETAHGDGNNTGAETDGTYFYTTIWNGPGMNKWDMDGTFVESFTITGASNVRDLAWDGMYFYGGAGATTIFEMDFDNKVLVSTITSPGACRAIAYDNGADGLWCNNWSSDLLLVSRTGAQLDIIPAPPSIYGCAYDQYTAGGPYLWLFAGTTSGGGCWVEQWDIAGKAFTGLMHSVSDDIAGGIAGGLFLAENIVGTTYTLGGCTQAAPDQLFGYELGITSSPWLTVNPVMGTVPPSGQADLDVNFDASDLDPGYYFANINVNTNDPFMPQVVVPVELVVGYTQEVSLAMGWSAWSSYVDPDMRMSMEEVMAPVLDQMIITQYFNELFYPEFGINTMAGYTTAHGYVSKMEEAATLPITGMMADPTVMLYEGWNLLPVISDCNVDITELALVPGFVIAWDIAGGGLYYPLYGINTIIDMVPGAAYYVKMDMEGSYTFPLCPFDATSSPNKPLRIENNTTWNAVNYTGVSHAVIFNEMASADLMTGDIIGSFTADGQCAGIAEVSSGSTGLKVFADDFTTLETDGFVDGEMLSYKLYRPATGDEFIIGVTYDVLAPNADGLFAVNGLSVVTDLTMTVTGINVQALNGLSVYPNPSTGIFNVSISNLDEDVNYVIVNAKGQAILEARLLETQEIDLSAEPKGVYFIKFMNDNVLRIEKVVIK